MFFLNFFLVKNKYFLKESRPGSGSAKISNPRSGSAIISNPGSGSALNGCGLETLQQEPDPTH